MNGNLKTMADSQLLSPKTPSHYHKLGQMNLIGTQSPKSLKPTDPKLALGSSSFRPQMMPQNDTSKQNKPINDQEFKKRALIVQESLLSYIKNTDKSKEENKGITSTFGNNIQEMKFNTAAKQKANKEEAKISGVKNMLRNLN